MNHSLKPQTGGHQYNNALLSYLKKTYTFNIITTPRCSETYRGWRKVFAPLYELKWVNRIKENNLVFLGDTCFKYHLLLLIVLRIIRRGSPIVILHHLPYLNNRGIVRYVNFIWQYIYYGLCKYIIVPSPYTRKMTENLFNKRKIVYIPLPLNKNFIVSNVFEEGRLLFVGTVEPRKGLDYLIDSINIIKDRKPAIRIQLDVVGQIKNKQYQNKLVRKIKRYGLDNCINFYGRVSDKQLENLYKKAEIFTFPSLLEGYGIVLIEAMNNGVPIVAFNNSAMPFTIKDGFNGMLAINKNVASFAEKIMQLSGNADLRLNLQQGMRETIEKVSTQEDFEKGIDGFVKKMRA